MTDVHQHFGTNMNNWEQVRSREHAAWQVYLRQNSRESQSQPGTCTTRHLKIQYSWNETSLYHYTIDLYWSVVRRSCRLDLGWDFASRLVFERQILGLFSCFTSSRLVWNQDPASPLAGTSYSGRIQAAFGVPGDFMPSKHLKAMLSLHNTKHQNFEAARCGCIIWRRTWWHGSKSVIAFAGFQIWSVRFPGDEATAITRPGRCFLEPDKSWCKFESVKHLYCLASEGGGAGRDKNSEFLSCEVLLCQTSRSSRVFPRCSPIFKLKTVAKVMTAVRLLVSGGHNMAVLTRGVGNSVPLWGRSFELLAVRLVSTWSWEAR